jgi:hypothetical protein
MRKMPQNRLKRRAGEQPSLHHVKVTEVIKEREGLWNLRQKQYEANVCLRGHQRRCVPVDRTAYTDGGHATASTLKDSLRERKSASGSRIPLNFL